MTEYEKAKFERVGYEPFKKYLKRYAGNGLPKVGDLPHRTTKNCERMGVILGFLKLDFLKDVNDALVLTERGQEMVKAYTLHSKEHEIAILREALKENDDFRLHWSWICDNREKFTVADLMPVFRKIGYSHVEDDSLKVYIRSYIDWARSAQLCLRIGLKGHAHKIMVRMKIGEMEDETQSETIAPFIAKDEEDSERMVHLSIYKLNTYICDFLADETHEGDLELITSELENIRASDIFDDLTIDLLEGLITVALQTKAQIAFAEVAKALRKTRERYIS